MSPIPIPINASMGMLLSLAIAFVVTPWLARLWMKASHGPARAAPPHWPGAKARALVRARVRPAAASALGRGRHAAGPGHFAGLIALSVLLPVVGLVQLKMLPFDNKSEFQVVVDMPAGTPVEDTAAVLRELGAYLATVPEVTDYQAYAGTGRADQLQRPGAPVLPARRWRGRRPPGQPGRTSTTGTTKPRHRHPRSSRAAGDRPGASAPTSRWSRCRPARRCCLRSWPRSTAPRPRAGARSPRRCAPCSSAPTTSSTSTTAASRARSASSACRPPQGRHARHTAGGSRHHAARGPGRRGSHLPARRQQIPGAGADTAAGRAPRRPVGAAAADRAWRLGKLVPIRELVTVSDSEREQPIHKDLLPVNFVTADMAGGKLDSPLYGMFQMRRQIQALPMPGGGQLGAFHQPAVGRAARLRASSGTASGRSPTRPSATWAPPTASAWS